MFLVNVDMDRNCPSGYRWFDYHCYKHMSHMGSHYYDTLRGWCRDEGADMPLFDYRNEWYFLEHWHGNQIYKLGLKYDTDIGELNCTRLSLVSSFVSIFRRARRTSL